MQAPTDQSNDAVKAFESEESPSAKGDASIVVIPPQAPSGPSGVGDKGDIQKEEEAPPQYVDITYWDITREFSILGWIAFGGPAAHIGLFQVMI